MNRPPHDPFEYIRNYYRVAAFKGARVEIEVAGKLCTGSIVGADGQYIRIRFDGDAKVFPGVFHPTDGVKYLTLAETN